MNESAGARARCTCGRGASRRLVRSDQTELPTRTGLLPGQTGASAWRGAVAGPLAFAGLAFAIALDMMDAPATGGARALEIAIALVVGVVVFFAARPFISRVGRVANARYAEGRREDPDAMWEHFEWVDAAVTVGSAGEVEIGHADCEFPSVSVQPSECAPAALGVLQGPMAPGSTLRLLRCPIGGWVTGARVFMAPTATTTEPVARH